MGVTRCNLKPIMNGSGRYHEIQWNVQFPALRGSPTESVLGLGRIAVFSLSMAIKNYTSDQIITIRPTRSINFQAQLRPALVIQLP